MSEENAGGGLHIDADWKTEAAQEKERLIAEEKKTAVAGTGSAAPAGSFLELVNLIAMQAAVGLGGYQGPGGERIPPNPEAAKFHIDLLEVLQEKTKGNLSDEETKVLDNVLYELRMHFVQVTTGAPPAPPTPPAPAPGVDSKQA